MVYAFSCIRNVGQEYLEKHITIQLQDLCYGFTVFPVVVAGVCDRVFKVNVVYQCSWSLECFLSECVVHAPRFELQDTWPGK